MRAERISGRNYSVGLLAITALGIFFAIEATRSVFAAPIGAKESAIVRMETKAEEPLRVPTQFSTIQAAVNAAKAGATIEVRPGTYTEQIVIAKDLTLKGAGGGKTIIKAPSTLTPFAQDILSSTPVAAIVGITDGANVRMSGFTVTGPTPCFGGSGISVVKRSTLDLSNSHVTLIRPADLGCPITFRSAGIEIGLPFFYVIDGEVEGGSTGHGTVTHVTVDKFLGTGIAVLAPFAGSPSTATISDNLIIGGSPFVTNQGGVTVSFASVARVTGNTIYGTVCTDPACGPDPINQSQSVGIGATLSPPGTVITENTVSGNDVGIYLFGSEGCCQISENRVIDNRLFGIIIQNGTGTTSENEIRGGQVGIGVVAGFVNTVGVLRGDEIHGTTVAPVRELQCCGFKATAIVKKD